MAVPAAAASAYLSAARIGAGGAPATAQGGDFSALLADATKDAVATLQAGEATAASHLAGKADLVDVVNAVTAAELTLETVVAVRDKVIAAYLDIMKMPI